MTREQSIEMALRNIVSHARATGGHAAESTVPTMLIRHARALLDPLTAAPGIVPGAGNCTGCAETGAHPSHEGATGCRSGSLASGGKNAHCTCDVCW